MNIFITKKKKYMMNIQIYNIIFVYDFFKLYLYHKYYNING